MFSHFLGPCLRNWHRIERESAVLSGPHNYLSVEQFRDLLREMFLRLLATPLAAVREGQLFVDKTPGHACWIPEIVELFSEARFIHVLRDARDVVASTLAASRGWGASWAPSHPRDAALDWQESVTAARDAMARLGGERITEVRYENLLADPAAELMSLFEFLKLPYTRDLVGDVVRSCDFSEIRGEGRSPGISFVGDLRKGRDERRWPKGYLRKGVAGSWRRDLSWREKYFVWRYARKTMRGAGYPWRLPI